MPIKAAFAVPHPPMIIPDIGKGKERNIGKTISAYETVAKEIAAINPDVFIISSPHTVMYSDYFHISPNESVFGSFADFGAGSVSFSESYDTELVSLIESICAERSIPAGTKGERDPRLDHGTMVPLYFLRKYCSHGKMIRVGLSGLPLDMHFALGRAIRDAVDKLERNAVFIASGDLSHRLRSYGPYGFAKEGPVYDERIMDVLSRGAFDELLGFEEEFLEKAAECGHRSFCIMAGALEGQAVRAKALSHEDITGVGYGICSFYPEQGIDPLVALARQTIESYVKDHKRISPPADITGELLNTRAGAFVSIHENGELRGCIGTILPTESSLAEEIISNAISASTRDPRFPPITEGELSALEINVDVLTAPEQIYSLDELDVKRYGVIVTSGYKRGLLLPDLEGVDTVEQQVSIAMQKGGISAREQITLHRFEVVRHK